jgi:outer membrane protein
MILGRFKRRLSGKRGFSGAVAVGVLAGIIGATPALLSAQTLADTLVSAYENSNLLEQNRALLRAADEDVAVAVSNLRPVIDFIAGSDYVGKRLGTTIDDLSASVGISADLLLYDFGRTRLGVESAKETVLATREALVDLEQRVLLQAVTAFMNVRSAVEFVQIGESNVRLLTEELRAARDRFEVGEVTRTDVSIAEARLASARSNLQAARGDLVSAREDYKAATGHFPGTLSDKNMLPALPATLVEAKSVGTRDHPTIRQAQHQVAAADLNAERAKAATRGQISAGAQATANEQFENSSTSLNLTFRKPIYQGGQLSALYRQALARAASTRANLLQTVRLVEQDVGRAWSDLEVARARIISNREQIDAARVAFEGAREEAKLGARTTLDVLDLEQDLLTARGDLIASVNLQNVAAYTVLASIGLLTVEHLNLGIPTYDPSAYYNAVHNAPATSVQGKRLDRVLQSIGKLPK